MIMNITGKTAVYGVIGDPVAHTLSPLIQNRAITVMGIDAVYVPFHVKPSDFENAIRGIVSLSVAGVNVTVPYKTEVMKYLDHVSDVALSVGAVNTIVNDNGVLTGDNTDVYGFEMCLEKDAGLTRFPERVAILGAGGAARGVAYACLMRDEVDEVIVLNRTFSKAEKLAEELARVTGKNLVPMPAEKNNFRNVLPASGLVVNTTSVGMHPDIHRSPLPESDVLTEWQIVCDIVYNPPETKLLKEARSHGAQTVGGLAMLAYQGARSLALWTGKEAPADVMLDVLKEKFGV